MSLQWGSSLRVNRLAPALAILLSVFGPLQARQDELGCGTHSNIRAEALRIHKGNTRAIKSGFRALALRDRAAAADQYAVADKGNIAILSDADGVIARPNSFDLQGKTIRFTRDGTGYKYATAASTFDAGAASRGTLLENFGDDDSRSVDIGFAFAFYAQSYSGVYVNSDGNLTFGAADASSSDRSLGRITAGPPRIAALFADLDPTSALDGVRVLRESSRLAVTWSKVPVFGIAGQTLTFQVILYPDGSIDLSYPTVTIADAIAAISPGKAGTATSLVSFVSNPAGRYEGTIAERFGSTEELDILTAAQKFYLNHDDAYDYLVFYNVLDIPASAGAVAYEVTVRNNRTGYGDILVDDGLVAGSKSRLQGIMNMGPLSQYPGDPNAVVPARSVSGDTPTTILGHESGHLFLAYASVIDEEDNQPMLGRQLAHWAFTFNSEASLLEGNRIRDNGTNAGSRFTTTATVQGYSPFDQYLMGFVPKESVSPVFYAFPATVTANRPPQAGVSFNGTRNNVSVDDIVAVVGRRTPDYTVSQRHFRYAFVLVTPGGRDPSAGELAQIEAFRNSFEQTYPRYTSNNASADAGLRKAVHVSTFPASGVAEGGRSTVTVELDAAPASPLGLTIETKGLVAAPGAVTVAAGAVKVTFEISGGRAGVDDLIVNKNGSGGYDAAYSKIQVLPNRESLLAVVGGDRQNGTAGQPLPLPLEVKATDINLLPYSGVTVQATPTPGGTVSPTSAVTGDDGIARFTWTPGPAAFNQLKFVASTGATTSAVTSGQPAIAADGVVNAASFHAPISPGGIASVFGINLFDGSLSSLQILVNGIPAPIFFANSLQANFLVPKTIDPGPAQVLVTTSAGASLPSSVNVEYWAPGIFYDTSSGYGAVLTNGTGQHTNDNPVARGGFIEIYATGLGPLDNSGLVSVPVKVLVGGAEMPVVYAGAAPSFMGLYQINAQILDSVPSGTQTVSMVVKDVPSNSVKIEVK